MRVPKHLYLIFLAFSIFSHNVSAEGTTANIEFLQQKLRQCMADNNYTLQPLQNCSQLMQKELLNFPEDSIKLSWELAELVRRNLGNQPAIEFYRLALERKTTPDLCVDDGLDNAVKAGLNLPHSSFAKDADIAIHIVFKTCWTEFKDEMIAIAKENSSSYLSENICRGAKLANASKLFPNCP